MASCGDGHDDDVGDIDGGDDYGGRIDGVDGEHGWRDDASRAIIYFGASAIASQAKMAGAQNDRIVRLGPNLDRRWFVRIIF